MKIDHVPGHKPNFSNHLRVDIIQIVFSNSNTRISEKALYCAPAPPNHSLWSVLLGQGRSRTCFQRHLEICKGFRPHHSQRLPADLPAQAPSRRASCLQSWDPTGTALHVALDLPRQQSMGCSPGLGSMYISEPQSASRPAGPGARWEPLRSVAQEILKAPYPCLLPLPQPWLGTSLANPEAGRRHTHPCL